MAFNNVGLFTLAPGQTGRYFVTFGGADRGAQSIHAHPLNPEGSLQVNDQTKVLNPNGTFNYWVTVKNIGVSVASFNLQGGGFS